MRSPAAGLRPEPDEGRDWLARELARAEYHDRSLLERLRDWLVGLFDDLTAAASGASPLSTFAGIVLAIAFIGLLAYVLPRVRRTPAVARGRDHEVLSGNLLSSAELRAQAEQALADGRPTDALGDAYRALALRQVERGTIEDSIGSTADELAVRMAARFPAHADRLTMAALRFDAVVYGEHDAVRADAQSVLALDDDLERSSPVDEPRAVRRGLAMPR